MRYRNSIVLVLLILCSINVFVNESYAVENAVSLSFIQTFDQQDVAGSIGYGSVSIGINAKSSVVFKQQIILKVKSSQKYVEGGQSTSLDVIASNVVTSLELDGAVILSIIGSIDIPIRSFKFRYSIPEVMGSQQRIDLGDYLLATVSSLSLSIFMRPVVIYTPTMRGDLLINGPSLSNPSTLMWQGESTNSQIHFLDTAPVEVTLANPRLTLTNFRVAFDFYALIGAFQTPTLSLDLIDIGPQYITSSSIHLISFEPNYYTLFTELLNNLNSLNSTLEGLQNNLNETLGELEDLKEEIKSFTSKTEDFDRFSQNLSIYEAQVTTVFEELDGISSSIVGLEESILGINSKTSQLETSNQTQVFYLQILIVLNGVNFLIAIYCLVMLRRSQPSS